MQNAVQIVEVKCPRCLRKFRTVPSVVENAGTVYCPSCGSRMEVSPPQSVAVLSAKKAHTAA